ncbi:putative reverse transcriptase domain-containing protein, partial [Tanacetum coccineum]
MLELREDTFSGNKNDDAHEHVERVLDIVSLFNIPGVSHDAVMLRVLPITLTEAAKRWVDKLLPRTVDSWDLLKRPLSKGIVHHQRLPSSLKKSITSSRKETRLYTKPGNGIMTYSINAPLMSSIAIRSMKPAQALTAIQTMANHSQKWHDGISSINTEGSSNSKGITVIVNKLENLGRDIKKLKENVHAIQVGCQICGGARLDKDFPLNEEVKSVEEAKYGKFGRPSHFMYTDKKTPHDNEQHEVSFDNCTQIVQEKVASSKVLPCQLPPKEMNPGNFTLPCTIGSLNFYAMTDLGASVNVIPKSMFEHLKLAQLKKTDMLVEMADMTKRSPIGIVKNVLVKIDKFLFLLDFVVMDMLNTRNETMIFGRPFLATIHVKIDVFNKEISLGIGSDRVTFDMNKKIHNFTTRIGEIYMINSTSDNEYTFHTSSDASFRVEKTDDLHNENNYLKDPRERSFDDYKWMFDLKVDQLADEYELGIGKKGHMLDDIWENCSRYKEVEFELCSLDTLTETSLGSLGPPSGFT